MAIFLNRRPRARVVLSLCAKQITAWSGSIESSPVQGKRHLTPEVKERRETASKAIAFRQNFLRDLKPAHPLYNTPEARAARGEMLRV